jgi:S-adenosylmethionine/arginine decarboxylase-like enzyme
MRSKRDLKTRKRKSWGYQLLLDISNCNPDAIRSKKTITEFVKELVPAIDMIAFGRPRIVRFGKGNLVGLTLVQLIEKSDITAHFVENSNDAYIDIFSCTSFDPKIAIRICKEYFQPEHIKVRFLKRQA